jgi:hypothetical protein
MVEGSVWGGDTETVLACDLIVAAETATFAVTPAKLGVPYNVSGMLTCLNAAPLRIVNLIEASGHGAASKAGYIAAADPHAGRSRNSLAEREASIHPFFAAFSSTWRSVNSWKKRSPTG